MTPPREPSARILVVDDDEDTRDLVTFALQAQQYAVTAAVDGRSALDALRKDRFDLVITDYDMPGLTGAEMLKQAGRDGLMGAASALIVTAHPDPSGVPDETPLLRKPIDLERLLVQVRTIVPAAGPPRRSPPGKAPKPAEDTRLDLALYVSQRSPASLRARHRMDEVLAEFDPAHVRFEVCDLFQHAAAAEKDRVVFTPTLVKRAPAPRAWIIGDLADDAVVRDLLMMCGVPERSVGKGEPA